MSKEFHQPVPGNPDARRFQVCSSSARRKDQGPLRTTDRIVKSTRIEIRVEENFPPLATIANREDVILRGADPILKADLSNEHRTAGDPA